MQERASLGRALGHVYAHRVLGRVGVRAHAADLPRHADARWASGDLETTIDDLLSDVQIRSSRPDGRQLILKFAVERLYPLREPNRGLPSGVELNAAAVDVGLGAEVSLKDFRHDVMIEVYNEGQLALAYKLYRCWVSEYQSLPDLDANAVAIQRIKLENEGIERDYEVPEPEEPSFVEP
jgi:T4-like virus tail tube protein gp19